MSTSASWRERENPTLIYCDYFQLQHLAPLVSGLPVLMDLTPKSHPPFKIADHWTAQARGWTDSEHIRGWRDVRLCKSLRHRHSIASFTNAEQDTPQLSTMVLSCILLIDHHAPFIPLEEVKLLLHFLFSWTRTDNMSAVLGRHIPVMFQERRTVQLRDPQTTSIKAWMVERQPQFCRPPAETVDFVAWNEVPTILRLFMYFSAFNVTYGRIPGLRASAWLLVPYRQRRELLHEAQNNKEKHIDSLSCYSDLQIRRRDLRATLRRTLICLTPSYGRSAGQLIGRPMDC